MPAWPPPGITLIVSHFPTTSYSPHLSESTIPKQFVVFPFFDSISAVIANMVPAGSVVYPNESPVTIQLFSRLSTVATPFHGSVGIVVRKGAILSATISTVEYPPVLKGATG